ncbi:MAG TPA: anthranilate synthase component I family protein [Acidimicrobiia bacterium]
MRPMTPDATAARVAAKLPHDAPVAIVRDGRCTIVACAPVELVVASGRAALEQLDDLAAGWWAGFVAYELGHAIERVVPRPSPSPVPPLPDLVLARFDTRAVIGPEPDRIELVGDGPSRAALEHAVGRARDDGEHRAGSDIALDACARSWRSSLSRPQFEARVATIIELIRAGECYQVNLTRRLTLDDTLDPVRLFGALACENPAPHSALLRLPAGCAGQQPFAVVSASPETFLRWRAGNVVTRPIKGTSRDRNALVRSAKDRAENVMIVDLARNDLGRVCVPGTITVPALCAPEAHPGLYHLVSTVSGQLRAGVGPGALLRATLAPASVTGAPKPRVLQVIEQLETIPRGVYCGAVGWIDTERDAGDLSVAIRTFAMHGARTELGVGAGIVADSDPAAEWRETELKGARLLTIAAASAGIEVGANDAGSRRGAATPVGA